MRVIGTVESHLGLGLHDHLCWVHDDPADYRSRVTEFFAEGLDRGLRVAYVGAGTTGDLREHLSGLHGLGDLLARDVVRIFSYHEVYGAGKQVDPSEVIRRYAAQTEEALADGYRGLRASADLTDIVRTPERQAAFCRYEFLIDRYLARQPLSAMCAYQTELGDAVRQFASVHPAATAGLTSFHVYTCQDGAVGLAGEAELACLPELEQAVGHFRFAAVDGNVVVDLSKLTFADHRALLALAALAERTDVAVRFRAVPAIARQIAGLLGIAALAAR